MFGRYPGGMRLRRTTSFRVEWRGMRPALKLQNKGCVTNAHTVAFASMRNADLESNAESDADTESVVVDESADFVVWEAVQPGARIRTRSRLETRQTMLVEYGNQGGDD